MTFNEELDLKNKSGDLSIERINSNIIHTNLMPKEDRKDTVGFNQNQIQNQDKDISDRSPSPSNAINKDRNDSINSINKDND